MKIIVTDILCNIKIPGRIVGAVLCFIFFLALFLPAKDASADTIYKGGVIESSEVWTSNNVYVVYLDLMIEHGVSLTILPGVEVRIKYGKMITIDNGIIRVQGEEDNKVYFVPDYSHPSHDWKWRGLTIRNVSSEDESYFRHAVFEDAQTAITIEKSMGVSIYDTKITECQNQAVKMFNSSYCYIINSEIVDNYSGIEIQVENLNRSSDNVIYNCLIENQDQNIYIYREGGGLYLSNLISTNLISGGNNGIWISNLGDNTKSENIIEKNIFVNSGGEVGYGIFLAHDSTIVRNNIFWNNNVAVYCENEGKYSTLVNNSFYENNWAVAMGAGSTDDVVRNNTFSENREEVVGIKEYERFEFINNNILNYGDKENIVVNSTPFDLSIEDNYWDTDDSLKISTLIYDYYDDPTLGKLEFVPFLMDFDTTNPMSPPCFVKKQLIDNQVRVVWSKNREQDLAGYRLYYGEYNNYSFSDSTYLGIDTTYFFTNTISITDDIAVTACDSGAVAISGILNGHESPYSFATLYPYAGGDKLLCKNQSVINITNSNAPMEYQQLNWSTSGDGTFDNKNVIHPNYYPGSDDIKTGSVLLTLEVISDELSLKDSLILSIIDDPFVETQHDTIIISDTDLEINNTYATNYTSVLWETTGDGLFNNYQILDPVYYPGYNDVAHGTVNLIVSVFSSCGFDSDTLKIDILDHFSLEGTVWGDNTKYSNASVVAFRKYDTQTRAFARETSVDNGYFKFDMLMTGEYYIHCVPDTNNPEKILPGYYANKLNWKDSHIINVNGDVHDVDVYLPQGDYTLPLGDASIRGSLQEEQSTINSDIYCTPWFDYSDLEFCTAGSSNITVLLYNSTFEKILDFTLTDNAGNFYFNNLPYGTYKLKGEYAGMESIPSGAISLDQENRSVSGIVLIMENGELKFTGYSDSELSLTEIYPNPAIDKVIVPLGKVDGEPTIEIFNITGSKVFSAVYPDVSDGQEIEIDISRLYPGIYSGRIISSGTLSSFKFFKK